MKKNKMYDNKGVTTADIVASVLIIIVFISVITTSFYNYYLSTTSESRAAMATNCVIDVIENVEAMDYEDVEQASVDELVQGFVEDGTIPSGYTLTAQLQKYNELEGNADKKDLIKILKVNVKYTINEKEENFEVTRLITK